MSIFKIQNIPKILISLFVLSIFILPTNNVIAETTPKEYFYYILFSDAGDQEHRLNTLELCEQSRQNMIDEINNHSVLKWWENISVSMCYREGPGLSTDTSYTLLAPLPELSTFESKQSPDNPCAFGNYLNIMIKLILGIAAVLAMIMLIKGGFDYMASSLPSEKESGKGTIANAIFGLLLALSAYLLLYTINPDLLNFCNIGKSIEVPKVEKSTK